MTKSSITRRHSLGPIVYREIADNTRATADAQGIMINPTAAGVKMHFLSTLRAEAPEFKPRTSSLSATASEFKPCLDRKAVKEAYQKLGHIPLSTSRPSCPQQNSRSDIRTSVKQYKSSSINVKEPIALSKAVPPAEFHLFSDLPAELRFKTWTLSLPGPRMIKLNYNRLTSRAISSTPAPVLLHTSRESRREAMKQYTLVFVKSVLNATVYIDCRIDTLCFFANKDDFGILDFEFDFWTGDSDYFDVMLRNIRPRIWQSLKHIAMSFDVQHMFPDLLVFSKLQSLTTVSVVLPGPGQGHGKNYRLVDIPWSGCTHIRTEKSVRDPTGAAKFMHTAPCCSDCKQIICQIHHLEYEIPYEWEPAEVL